MSGTDFPGDWSSVLAVTEPGPAGDDVLAAAGEIAASLGAELHVLAGLGLIGAQLGDAPPLLNGTYIQSRAILLEEQIARMSSGGRVPRSVKLAYRRADQALARRADIVGADLIVVPAGEPAPVGFGPPRETLAAAALRSGRPTLLARGAPRWPPAHVIRTPLGEGAGVAGAPAGSGWAADPEESISGEAHGAGGALDRSGAIFSTPGAERAYARGRRPAGSIDGAGRALEGDPAALSASSETGTPDLVVVTAPPSAFEWGGEGTRIAAALTCAILVLPGAATGTPDAPPGSTAAALAP